MRIGSFPTGNSIKLLGNSSKPMRVDGFPLGIALPPIVWTKNRIGKGQFIFDNDMPRHQSLGFALSAREPS
jgi:hypothetical protein